MCCNVLSIFTAMKQTLSIRRPQLVFSRWSRKSYAVFISLGKVVKIGRLAVDICRMAMLKSAVLINANNQFEFGCVDEDDDCDDGDLPEILMQQQLMAAMSGSCNQEIYPIDSFLIIHHTGGGCCESLYSGIHLFFYSFYGYTSMRGCHFEGASA